MENIIFYFSGTGNSLYVAQELAAAIENCRIEAMTQYDPSNKISAERIGLVFPTYYWGLPNIVKKFIMELQVVGSPYFFTGYTFGGYSGVTAHMTRKMIQDRGWTLSAAFGFQLPQNFILSSFRVPDDKTQEHEFQKADARFLSVAKMILNKGSYFESEPLHVKPFHFVGYLLNASQAKKIPTKDIDFIISNRCKGCGLCARGCPVRNIEIKEGHPNFMHHCEFCLQCLHTCPEEAIDYRTETRGRKRYRNPKSR